MGNKKGRQRPKHDGHGSHEDGGRHRHEGDDTPRDIDEADADGYDEEMEPLLGHLVTGLLEADFR